MATTVLFQQAGALAKSSPAAAKSSPFATKNSLRRCALFPLDGNKRKSGNGRLECGRIRRRAPLCAVVKEADKTITGEAEGDEAAGFAVGEADLLVVGPGVLGCLIGRYWLQGHEGCKVIGQTNTTNRHEELLSVGIVPVTKSTHAGEKYPFVVFSAPPYGNEDYVAEVRAAAQRWNGEGSLLFTSSSAVYNVNDNGICDESSPVVVKGRSPRIDLLLNAEEEVLKVGGNVVRLAGLYTRDRGAHVYWLQKGTVDARPDHYLNLIHYEDAAELCCAILRKKICGQVFMGCDNTPVSRREIMDAILASGKFEGQFQGFTNTEGPLGKRMNNNGTQEKLGWQPKHGSFAGFIASL